MAPGLDMKWKDLWLSIWKKGLNILGNNVFENLEIWMLVSTLTLPTFKIFGYFYLRYQVKVLESSATHTVIGSVLFKVIYNIKDSSGNRIFIDI